MPCPGKKSMVKKKKGGYGYGYGYDEENKKKKKKKGDKAEVYAKRKAAARKILKG